MKKLIFSLVLALGAFGQQTQQSRIVICTDAGASDTYACSPTPAVTSYTTGLRVRLFANTANTGAATVNLSTLGAKTIVKLGGGIATALADNDIRAGQYADLIYDGTNFQMLSQLGNAAAGSSGLTLSTADQGIYWTLMPTTVTAASAPTALRTYFSEFTLPYAMTVRSLSFRLMTGGNSAGHFTIGVYNSSCSKLFEATHTNLVSTGFYNLAVSPSVDLTAGTYFVAYSTDDSNNTAAIAHGSSDSTWYSIANAGRSASSYRNFNGDAAAAGPVLPSTCGTRSVTYVRGMPVVALLP